MARFMQGEVTVPEDIWPLVCRAHPLATLSGQTHTPSDLYMIELASAKELTVDGVAIQLNYLKSNFPDFFADHQRARAYWDLAEVGDTAATTAFLEDVWSGSDARRADAALLARIKLTLVTRDSLARDIRTLAKLLPEVVFVTHVDARKPDGQAIKSRSDFVDLVTEEVRNAGLEVYDPTQLMAEFGQRAAIEDHSTGLAHFTQLFSAAIMEDWMARYIAPKTDAALAQGKLSAGAFLSQIDAACQSGRHATAVARLAAMTRQTGDYGPLLKKVHRTQKAAQKKFNSGLSSDGTRPLEAEETVENVTKAGALGLFDTAKMLATDIDERFRDLPCHVMTDVARQAAATGDVANAAAFAVAALRENDKAERAIRLLADLVIAQKLDLSGMLDHAHLVRVQSVLSQGDIESASSQPGAPLRTLISRDMDAADIARIAAATARKAGLAAGTRIVAIWRELHKMDRISDTALNALLDQWAGKAAGLRDPLERIQCLVSLQQAAPRHAGIRKAVRTARTDLVTRVRDAGKEGDLRTLSGLRAEVDALPVPLPEFDLWRARLSFDRGAFDEAVNFGTSAATQMPDKLNVWVILMRASVKTGQASLAEMAADKVVALTGEKTHRLRAEAERVKTNMYAEV